MSDKGAVPFLDGLRERPSRARYDKVHLALERKWRRRELKGDRMMKEVVDQLWEHFAQSPYSWCGFYLLGPGGHELILGPHRDKPGLSPLPMSGSCGKAVQTGKAVIVSNPGDPQRLSEITVPVYDSAGVIWGVLDVGSLSAAAFDEMDQRWLEKILKPFQEVGKAS